MLFMVGIKSRSNESYDIVIPVFNRLGYVGFAAAQIRGDILYQAKVIILTLTETAINDGHLIHSLNEGYQEYRETYSDFTEWLALEIPVEALKGRPRRVNVTLSEPLLARIDAHVEYNHQFKDRSDFIATAADRLILTSGV